MITLAPSDTLYAVAGSASAVTYTIFGMQMSAGSPSWRKLAQGQVSNSVGLVYTSPGGTTSLVAAIVLLNATSAAVNVQLFSGGTTAAKQLFGVNVPAYGQMFIDQSGIQVNDASGALLLGVPTVMSPNAPSPVVMTSAAGAENAAARRDHVHGGIGGIGNLPTPQFNGNTSAVGAIPPNVLQNGSVLRVQFTAQISSGSGNGPFWWMLGPSGVVGFADLPDAQNATYTPANDVWLSPKMSFTGNALLNTLAATCLVTLRTSTGSLLVPHMALDMKDNYGGLLNNVYYRAGTTGYLGSGKIDPSVTNYLRLAFCPPNGNSIQFNGTGFMPLTGAIELVM